MESIWLYTMEQWGVAQADAYTDALSSAFELLARNPRRGRTCDDIRKSYRRHLVGRHVVYYRVRDRGIDVVRILHGRMDAARHT